MAWPPFEPGSPVFPGDPTTEAINHYGAGGLWYSRGTQYRSPGFFDTSNEARIPQATRGPFRAPYAAPVSPAVPRDWIAAAEPREPFRGWAVSPTPQPSTDLVPVRPPEGTKEPNSPYGKRVSAPKVSSEPARRKRGTFAAFYRGRRL